MSERRLSSRKSSVSIREQLEQELARREVKESLWHQKSRSKALKNLQKEELDNCLTEARALSDLIEKAISYTNEYKAFYYIPGHIVLLNDLQEDLRNQILNVSLSYKIPADVNSKRVV